MTNSQIINQISDKIGVRKTYIRGIIDMYLNTITSDLKKNSSKRERSTFNIPWFWTIKVEYRKFDNPAVLKSKKGKIIRKFVATMSFSQKFKESINNREE